MDPITIGLIVSAVAGVAGKAVGTPLLSGTGQDGFMGGNFMDFDNSGFVVNVGRGSATSTNAKTTPTPLSVAASAAGAATGPAGALSPLLNFALSPIGLLAIGV